MSNEQDEVEKGRMKRGRGWGFGTYIGFVAICGDV